jgi:hypothetical protein
MQSQPAKPAKSAKFTKPVKSAKPAKSTSLSTRTAKFTAHNLLLISIALMFSLTLLSVAIAAGRRTLLDPQKSPAPPNTPAPPANAPQNRTNARTDATKNRPVPTPPPAMLIGNLKDPSIVEGCGCAFQTLAESNKPSTNKYLFWSESTDKAIVNLAGKDTELKLISHKNHAQNRRPRKGDRVQYIYGNDKFRLELNLITITVCAPNDEDCESTGYNGAMVLIKTTTAADKQEEYREVVKISGACGC